MSRVERTGWRDQQLSERHRRWGEHVPAVDLAFLLIEYDSAEPAALIDYKAERPRRVDLEYESSLRALARLGDRARLPAFVVWYAPAAWRFQPAALNELGRRSMPAVKGSMGELEFVSWLYRLRGRDLPADVARRLVELETLRAA